MNKKQELPVKRSVYYSQNFLWNSNLVADLINQSSLTSNDEVCEIGAGTGIITAKLAKKCHKVVAIEADHDLYVKLRQRFAQTENIDVIFADFLSYKLPNHKYKIFSNPPFNITANVIRKITEAKVPPIDAYLIVQKEAALKYAGSPRDKETLSSVLIKPWFESTIVHNFSKHDFIPTPKVNIVLLRLKERQEPLIDIKNKLLFNNFIAYAFRQWKPTLQEGLKNIFTSTQFIRLSKECKFPSNATLTEMPFDAWLGLFNFFLLKTEPNKKKLVAGFFQKIRQEQAGLKKIHRTRVDKNWRRKFWTRR